ncbi:hypothetical protein [Saccharomonospora xinjiangensis]|nr:hypothetical protein [Saccharomonospora xinjiangensis]
MPCTPFVLTRGSGFTVPPSAPHAIAWTPLLRRFWIVAAVLSGW